LGILGALFLALLFFRTALAQEWHPQAVNSPASGINCQKCFDGKEGVAWPLAEVQRIFQVLTTKSLKTAASLLPNLQTDFSDRETELAGSRAALAARQIENDALRASLAAKEVQVSMEKAGKEALTSALRHTQEALNAATSSSGSFWTILKVAGVVVVAGAAVAVVALAVREIRSAAQSTSPLIAVKPLVAW
jgi:hypothetical protein